MTSLLSGIGGPLKLGAPIDPFSLFRQALAPLLDGSRWLSADLRDADADSASGLLLRWWRQSGSR